jgi:hypothetical protein
VRFVAIQPYSQANTPFREALMDDVNIKIFDDGLVPFLSEYIVVRKSYLD